MNKLTNEEINKYINAGDPKKGIRPITREELIEIDLDTVMEVTCDGSLVFDKNGSQIYKKEHFIPKANSQYLKPSFGGRQVLMGRCERELFFSNGVWFMSFY